MGRYIPNTIDEQRAMLREIGLTDMEELFESIPKSVRANKGLNLPEPMSEPELVKHMKDIASKNVNTDEYACFLGAGVYDHYIPSVVEHILSRQEFYTAYTPYQPEISQGTLQAIFEYQTMICELTGMDVANASLYDGATALAEACSVARRSAGKSEILVARTVHPEYRDVINTYSRFSGGRISEIGYKDGSTDIEELEGKISKDTAAVIIQSPNFFGVIEDLEEIGQLARKNNILLIVSADPVSLALLKPPGEFGADIVVGEGQALGNPLSFGGPYLGFFAAKNELLRKMPGRIAGQTVDGEGRRGFVLTIQAREQHIRREKATSNVCSNQALNALAAAVYLTVMGRRGLKEAAKLCMNKAHYAYGRLLNTGKFTEVFKAPFFKEFVVKSSTPVEELNRKLLDEKIIGGYDLYGGYPELENAWLVAVTEKRSREEIDKLVEVIDSGWLKTCCHTL